MIRLSATLVLFLSMTTLPALAAEQPEIHPEVQKALDYQLRQNTCEPPKRRQSSVNSNPGRKMKKALERYQKCVISYKQDILEDFNQLRGSAQYGLTQAQADQILGKMAVIQKAIESKYGVPMSDEEVKARMADRQKRD